VWLELRPETLAYEVVPNTEVSLSAETAIEISRRALRPGERGLRGPLSGGAHLEIAPAVRPDGRRLAFICDRTLSEFERGLLAAVAERSRLAPAPAAQVDRRDETRAKRRRAVSRRPAALIIDLRAFEDVRLAAGQLSAERVTTDAWGHLRALLRESDDLVRLDEDRFGVVLHVTDESQVHAVGKRIADTLAEVPVPRRAAPIRPTLQLLNRTELESDPALSRLLHRLDQPSTPRRAA
jgi:GGDEF domain-containing protein